VAIIIAISKPFFLYEAHTLLIHQYKLLLIQRSTYESNVEPTGIGQVSTVVHHDKKKPRQDQKIAINNNQSMRSYGALLQVDSKINTIIVLV
jgi:hypothetical protein